MRWSELVQRARLATAWQGGPDPVVTSVVEDSREVQPGACFVALHGTRNDGHAYIEGACRAGARVVVCERPVQVPPDVAILQVASARGLSGRLASALYGVDALCTMDRLKIVGITGTNGKSTFCYLVRAILCHAGYTPAMLGTVEYDLVSRKIPADHTTPPASALMRYLAEAAQAGASHAVMEVSSHALDQGRVDGLSFAVGVFSNLTGDHLDYHHTMDAYLAAKKRLFDGLAPGATAVVNADDAVAERIVADCQAKVHRYGILPAEASETQAQRLTVAARIEAITTAGTRFELILRPHDDPTAVMSRWVDSPLIGRHNVYNCLAAVAAALAVGCTLEQAIAGLLSQRVVPGRLQRVQAGSGDITVLVDYAHTDDALVNVLTALRPLATGQLIVVFGCGGDRDATKRPRMARAVAQFADRIVVTSDNPRSEDPQRIIDDVLTGFTSDDRQRVVVEPDRRSAIGMAIAAARPGDVVLVAGKGHENYQLIGGRRIDFDDAQVAAEYLRTR